MYIKKRTLRLTMVNKIVSEDYADIIVQNRNLSKYQAVTAAVPLDSRVSMINLPRNEIDKCSFSTYGYQAFPSCYTVEVTLSLTASRIPNVQNISNLGMVGQGVMVAVIDTGIDYLHDAFKNADNTTRIHSIWDQTITEEENANGTNTTLYGKEFTRDMINQALASENPLDIVPSKDEIGHGTAMAGIIAGNEKSDDDFRGVAPQAEIIVVKLKEAKGITKEMYSIPENAVCYQETDIIFALNYVKRQAEILDRPLAICIALGSNQGSHDGRGVLSTYLTELSDMPGICVVVSAGNEGIGRRHWYGVLSNNSASNEFQVRVGKDEPGFSMEVWKSSPSRIGIDITSPTGEYIKPIYPSISNCLEHNFIFVPTTVWINNFLMESSTADQLILIRFRNPSEGLWKFRVYNLDNQSTDYHVWLPSKGLISEETYFIDSNPDTTITSPGNSYSSITVSAYNHQNDSIYYASSRGVNRKGVLKPELAAPGVEIICPINNNRYGTLTGTSAAAAHLTGITAMLLEWGIVRGNNPSMDGIDIKSMLIRGAKRNPEDPIDHIWGYGRVDAYGVFESLTYR